ncbi:uncharacterized protein LOC132731930 [Ruditapes philippinarum]|uniref:uncharacterized protein LOC132731930 n=1 Tax=Ruditapes philippinarum TaxID=129788 RepID=UPI00295C19A2|nr:uncharacterized protein LOC132731930 [Ruditapes philippinarum]
MLQHLRSVSVFVLAVHIDIVFTGTTRTPAITATQQNLSVRHGDRVNHSTIGYFYVIGSVATIVLIAVLMYVIRWRYLSLKNPQDSMSIVGIPTYCNKGTDLECVNVESDNAANNYESLSNNRVTDNVYNDLNTAMS